MSIRLAVAARSPALAAGAAGSIAVARCQLPARRQQLELECRLAVEDERQSINVDRFWRKEMQPQAFDLNDIFHEPSDEQLDALMEEVAAAARRHSQSAREQLMLRLRAEITAIKLPSRAGK
ncbi:hypothetical protein [Candidatus Accumulibacter phosphatis]|uniref:hypothetical protein n=1 Tax=Candidatus Accumulibacter phosphatis TaxID=327160 RepID=UPI0039B9BF12